MAATLAALSNEVDGAHTMKLDTSNLQKITMITTLVVFALLFGFTSGALTASLLERYAHRTKNKLDDAILEQYGKGVKEVAKAIGLEDDK